MTQTPTDSHPLQALGASAKAVSGRHLDVVLLPRLWE